MTFTTPRNVVGRYAAVAATLLALAPATAQEESEPAAPVAVAAPAQGETARRPIPDPPRFVNEIVGTVGDVNGDLFWWGQSVNLAGAVMNNAFVGGSTASIDGVIGSDVFVFAGTTYVTGEVYQNVYAMTAQMFVNEGAVIHGNLMCFCGALTLNGEVRGQVLGSGGSSTLAGEAGSVQLETGSLVVTDDAVIHGDLIYRGNKDASIAEGAQIGGEVRRNPKRSESDEDSDDEEAAVSPEAAGGLSFWDVASNLWWYLANLTVGLAALLFGGRFARAPVERLREQAAVGLGFGFVVAVVVPVACLIGFLLLITLPLGVIVMQFYILAVFLSRLVTAQYLGDWILRRLGQQQPSEYLALAGGLVLFFLATQIPYVGFLIWLTALFLGFGGMFLAARGRRPGTVAPTQA